MMKDACCMRWGRRSRSECVFPSEVCVNNFALAVKLIVLVLSAIGLVDMWAAVFADVGVSVIAIINAMRALKVK